MQLDDALVQIAEIRAQIARSEVFRGYRAATVACTGILAFAAAALQETWVAEPVASPGSYLLWWIGVAALSAGACGVEVGIRFLHSPALDRQTTLAAVGQFAPCLAVGGLLTYAIYALDSTSVWMLPALWSLLFSLGIFASYRWLPRATVWVAAWYLAAGVGCFVWSRGSAALSPWAMAVTFGCGQCLAAAVLYLTLERKHGAQA